jgi:hypothetical protein
MKEMLKDILMRSTDLNERMYELERNLRKAAAETDKIRDDICILLGSLE